jgi:hypothetical protein
LLKAAAQNVSLASIKIVHRQQIANSV